MTYLFKNMAYKAAVGSGMKMKSAAAAKT